MKTTKNKPNQSLNLAALLTATATLSGCMNNGYRTLETSSSSSGKLSGIKISVTPAASPSPTTSATPAAQLPAASSQRVGAIGYTSTSITVKARKVLKLRFTPGMQDETISGSTTKPLYSGLGVYISVGSTSTPTPFLYNGMYGGAAQNSGSMDFSASIPQSCASSDAACREDVTITVSRPNYDWYCLNGQGGCPWAHVQDTHPWNGTLQVQTDDTQAL